MELTGNRPTGSDWRKLFSTRRGTVIVAVVCTLMAAVILVYAAAQYRQSVASSEGTRTVLVANGTIPKGTSGDVIASQQLFHTQSIAAKQVSAGAIADTALLRGKVAMGDISPGQQLTANDFTPSRGYATELSAHERIVSIPLDASHGLQGVVEVGDRVDIYADLNVEGTGGGLAGGAVRLIVSDVPVLAIDQNSGSVIGGGSGQQANVVLRVKASDAGALAYASDHGKIWLALRGPGAAEPGPQAKGVYNVQTLLRGTPSGG